jgi:hypothetical protein
MNTYFSVYVRATKKGRSKFLCHTVAADERSALKTARKHGLSVGRGSYAVKIGRDGYYASMRVAFPNINITQ